MKMKSTRGGSKPAARARRPRSTPGTIAGVKVTAVNFFGSLKGGKTITTYCPFCEVMVKASQKGYLMACKKCGQRIDWGVVETIVFSVVTVVAALATLAYAAGFIGPKEPDLTAVAIERDRRYVDELRRLVEGA
jgi:hypothetical protein